MKRFPGMAMGRNGSIVACVIEMVIGILLLIDPVGFTTGIVVALGAVLAILGLVNVIRYFRSPVQLYGDLSLGQGILMMLAGLFCMGKSEWILAVLPALFTVYGVIMLVSGVMKIQHVVDLRRMGHPRWYMAGISALAYVIIAVIILTNPFGTAMMVWTFVGVSMIASAVLNILSLIIAG